METRMATTDWTNNLFLAEESSRDRSLEAKHELE